MRQAKPIIHGSDHLPGHADPIRGLSSAFPLMAFHYAEFSDLPDTADDEYHMLAFDLGPATDNDLFTFDADNYAFITETAGIWWQHVWSEWGGDSTDTAVAYDHAISIGTNSAPLTYNPATNFGVDPGEFAGGTHPPGSWVPSQTGDYFDGSAEIKNFNIFQPGEMPLAFQLFYKHNGPSTGVSVRVGITFIVWPGTFVNHGPNP